MPLRNDAAFLLGRPDLVVLPGGTFQNPSQYFLLNLTQRQALRLSYRKETPAGKRTGGKAEIIPLDGGPALPMPEDFVTTHDWGLKFEEGGTILSDTANHRWSVPGTKESLEQPPPTTPEAEALFRQSVPNYRKTVSSSDGSWAAVFREYGQSWDALHIFKDGQPGPVLVDRQRGGGTRAAFPHSHRDVGRIAPPAIPRAHHLTGIDLSPSGRWLTAVGGYEGARWLWDLHALERELRSLGLGWSD